jgi:hypothetical protein
MNPMNLGQFIDALSEINPNQGIYYDWGSLYPTHFESYRGYYDQLALGIDASRSSLVTVGSLLQHASDCIDKTFTGWKGGEYTMSRKTMLWVCNPGMTSDTVIVGVRDAGYGAVIQTFIQEE